MHSIRSHSYPTKKIIQLHAPYDILAHSLARLSIKISSHLKSSFLISKLFPFLIQKTAPGINHPIIKSSPIPAFPSHISRAPNVTLWFILIRNISHPPLHTPYLTCPSPSTNAPLITGSAAFGSSNFGCLSSSGLASSLSECLLVPAARSRLCLSCLSLLALRRAAFSSSSLAAV